MKNASEEILFPSSDEELLSVQIRRKFAGFHLDIAFAVSGGLTVLFGPSGSGKSLTLQALAGLLPLDTARITLGNTVWQDTDAGICVPPQQRRVGYVPQNYALFPHLTVAQNIAFGMKKDAMRATRVAELVSLMQLDGLEQRRPAQLSGGQQQRVALARAIAVNPHLLLLDEPFSALDAPVRVTLREELRAFYERVKIPTVLVTHDMQEVQQLADTVVVIQQGSVLQVGTQQDVFRSPRTPAVAALVGMRPCLEGTVQDVQPRSLENGQSEGSLETIRVGDLELHALVPSAQTVAVGQRLEFAIRSDEVELVSEERTLHQDGVQVAGVVVREQFRSPVHILSVQLTPEIRLDIPILHQTWRMHSLSTGSLVRVRIPASAVHVFTSTQIL